MDQLKIGKFIACCRKEQALTQKALADILMISDKTVSKWECGKGLPEVSLMLPLCKVLNITVNELLSAEKIEECNYKKKAEENMMDLIKENQENKNNMLLSIICGSITIIAVTSLIIIASFIALPTIIRILLIFVAIITAIFGIMAAAFLDIKAGYFECEHCHQLFKPTMSAYVKTYHTFTKRKLTCPYCQHTTLCKKRIIKR